MFTIDQMCNMFYKIDQYPFLIQFGINMHKINAEFSNAIKKDAVLHSIFQSHALEKYTDNWVKDNGFHVNQIGYDLRDSEGSYTAIAVYKKGFTINEYDVPALFPTITALLQNVPNVHYAAFVRMSPQSILKKHIHTRRHLVFHILLTELQHGACRMICGDDERSIRHIGDTVLFDYSIEHGTINEASNERINFVIDFNPFTND